MADDVTTRVAKLERRCRLQGYALMGLAALLAATWAFPRRSTPPPAPAAEGGDMPALLKAVEVAASRIATSRIDVIGEKGQILASLDGKGGFGALDLRTDRGGWGTQVTSNGLTIVNSQGAKRAGIAAHDTGDASLFLRDERGDSSVSISGGDDPGVVIGSTGNHGVLQFGVSGDEPHMEYKLPRGRFTKVLP